MTTLDPDYCADGCGRLAETERPMGVTKDGDLIVELVCLACYSATYNAVMGYFAASRITFDQDMGEL